MTFSTLLKILKENEGKRVVFTGGDRSGRLVLNEEGDFYYELCGAIRDVKFTMEDFTAKNWKIIEIKP